MNKIKQSMCIGLYKAFIMCTVIVTSLFPSISAQAATEAEVDMSSKCGLKQMVFEEMPEDLEETEKALENVYVSEEDIAYWSKFSSDYYYNMLSDVEKAWWDDMEAACIAAAVGTEDLSYIKCKSTDYIGSTRIRQLLSWFRYSHPQYYFLDNSVFYSDYSGSIGVLNQFFDGETRKVATEKFTQKIDLWLNAMHYLTRPEDKEKTIHDIVCGNTTYERNDFDQSAYSVVCLGKTVCAGYAATFQLLCNAVGIETITVTSDTHAWNVVNIHGNWYQVDATWDDLDMFGGNYYYKYYNKSRQTVQSGSTDHYECYTWDGALTDAKYDMMTGNSHVSPYISLNDNLYFIVNENTSLGKRMVKLVDSNGWPPANVTYNGKTYVFSETGAKPVISCVEIIDVTKDGYTVRCKADDESGINRVAFPTWTAKDGQDDIWLDWYESEAVIKPDADGYYTYRVKTSNHNEEGGCYYTHVYAYDAVGNHINIETETYVDREAPVFTKLYIKDLTGDGYTVVCAGTDNVGIVKTSFPTWTEEGGHDDLFPDWGDSSAVMTPNADGEYEYRVKISEHNNEAGHYITHAYLYDAAGNIVSTGVETDVIPLESVSISAKKAELLVGGKKQLKIIYKPTNTSENMTTKWSSSDTNVATVSSKGVVTAKGRGEATITAKVAGKTLKCVVTVKTEEEIQIEAFVERMYTVALGRKSDTSGIIFWTEQLITHQANGAGISEGFILSEEFEEKNYSDAEYLKVLYKTFFNREADEGGIAHWTSQLNAGKNRRSVLVGFVNSTEFDELCTAYGIDRGTMTEEVPAEGGVAQFVERMYTICLERASEPAGLAEWTRRINERESTPEEVAKFFFLSEEYVEKNTSNEKYIETLYLTFMDRASEASGKAYWVDQLNQGVSRATALEGFAQSPEFQEIMDRYGL